MKKKASADAIAAVALVPLDTVTVAEAAMEALSGKLGRITDLALGFGVAGEMAEVVGVGGDKLLCRI